MAKLEIRLLGGLEVLLDGNPLTFPTRHSALVLACLAMAPEMRLTRGRITELLWTDRAEEQARATLRQTLYRLKSVIGGLEPAILQGNRRHVWLSAGSVWCDVMAFKQALGGDENGLAEAFALYNGELIEGHGVGGETFEAWLSDERISLRKLATDSFFRLAENQHADRRFADVEATVRKLLAIDPLDEPVHRLLMSACALQDQRNAALNVYKEFCRLLQNELGVDPEPETVALSVTIRDGTFSSSDASATDVSIQPDPVLRPSERAYIAVLPFDNMSDEPDQEYFSDAITEDLIAGLSRVSAFYVIARNSTFTYRGRAVQIKQVSQELGARYVIEGSVRRVGDRVRITVQLIDAEYDRHIWAERYDREVGDIFALQDEITQTLVGAIEPELGEAESERASRKSLDHLNAWDCHHRATWHCYKMTKENFVEGLRLLHQATELDPTFGHVYGSLAIALHAWVLLGHSDAPKESIAKAVEAGRRAVTLDGKDAHNHYGLGRAYTLSGDLDGANSHFQLALEINPSYALAHHGLVTVLALLGQHDAAVGHADTALRLSPRDPLKWTFLQVKAHALYHLRRYDEAAETARISTHYPGAEFWCWVWLGTSLAQLGRIDEAKEAISQVRQKNQNVTLSFIRTSLPWRIAADLEHAIEGLQKAGLPE
jgi:TolB-like protein